MSKRGVILAGGKGTRLQPATFAMNKHMVPILNKPMILYPLETLKRMGFTDILIVSGGNHIGAFADFLGDGSEYGVTLTYKVQKDSGGIAQALALAENFVGFSNFAVILGDNIFGPSVDHKMPIPVEGNAGIYIKNVDNASRFGVYDSGEIIEKPKGVKKGFAVTGLYIYPRQVFDYIRTMSPSARGEMEITDVNNHFLKKQKCSVMYIHDFWSDAGTPESLADVTKWALDSLPPQV